MTKNKIVILLKTRHKTKICSEVNTKKKYLNQKKIVASASAGQSLPNLEASKIALHKLGYWVPSNIKSPTNMKLSFYTNEDGTSVIIDAKLRLHQLCRIKRWPKPKYMYVLVL